MTNLFGQAWLTARSLTGGLLLAGFALVLVGILQFTARVFLRAPFAVGPGYFQWQRGLILAGFVTLALGLAGLNALLRQAGDPLLSDVAQTALVIATVLFVGVEVTWLTQAALPTALTGALLRLAVVLAFVAQAAFGAALLQTGLLPRWLGWFAIVWNLVGLAVLAGAGDPYYPFMHIMLPLLAGLLLLRR
ncbi:MAG: hypothetical protein IT317_10205 [Anaerolineales bacterium]|nr:hypothetical protein [Anaerolineales bacterium]